MYAGDRWAGEERLIRTADEGNDEVRRAELVVVWLRTEEGGARGGQACRGRLNEWWAQGGECSHIGQMRRLRLVRCQRWAICRTLGAKRGRAEVRRYLAFPDELCVCLSR